jgi:predicted PurR-regulated permease PerM
MTDNSSSNQSSAPLQPPFLPLPWRLSLQGWLSLFALGVSFWFVINLTPVLAEIGAVIIGSLLIAMAIAPVAERLEGRGIRRISTVSSIYLIAFALLVLAFFQLAPYFLRQLDQFLETLRALPSFLGNLPVFQDSASGASVTNQASQLIQILFALGRTALVDLASIAVDVGFVIVLSFLFSLQGLNMTPIVPLLPPNQAQQSATIFRQVRSAISYWAWAQLGISVYFGFAFGVGLALIGVPLALVIGTAGVLLRIIPYFGAPLTLLLAFFTSLTISPWLALGTIIVYAIVKLVERLLSVNLYGRATGFETWLVVLALFIGAKTAGVVGVLFAIPVTVVITAVAQALYDNRVAQMHDKFGADIYKDLPLQPTPEPIPPENNTASTPPTA